MKCTMQSTTQYSDQISNQQHDIQTKYQNQEEKNLMPIFM